MSFVQHLKNTPLAGRIASFVSNWSKLANNKGFLQIATALKISLQESPYQKQKASGTEASRNRSSETDQQGSNSTCSKFKKSVIQEDFSETEKKQLFPTNYEFQKFKTIHSIFRYQNGKSVTSKICVATKQSNDKISYPRRLLQCSPLSRITKMIMIPVESESIIVPISLFLRGICSEDLHENSNDFYVSSQENKHSIQNLSQQHSNNRKEFGGNLNESRHVLL